MLWLVAKTRGGLSASLTHHSIVMGGTLSRIFERVWGRREYRILIVGLDGAGKTTILYRLQTGDVTSTIPTIGFNVESITIKNIKFQVWDLGGQTSIRPYWRCYYANTDGLVYVIDSSDKDRLGTARAELSAMLQEEELKRTSLLILANKQDLKESLNPTEISEVLRLTDIKDRSWSIQKTSALTGEGLEAAFDWLINAIKGS